VSSDDRLIDATLDGNTAAFGDLVRKYQDRLFTTMVHAIGVHAEAEDVVQEAFAQAFVKLSSFKRQSQFYTWLYRIAFNTWLSRRRRRRPTLSLERNREMLGTEPMDASDSAEDQVIRHEDIQILHESLLALAEDHRQILVLREIDERSYEEIAEICELPVGTVRSRLHRARKQLLESMKQRHPEMFTTP
jgi:RNA polymerase sigma-70 factor (ECF subfamily)